MSLEKLFNQYIISNIAQRIRVQYALACNLSNVLYSNNSNNKILMYSVIFKVQNETSIKRFKKVESNKLYEAHKNHLQLFMYFLNVLKLYLANNY